MQQFGLHFESSKRRKLMSVTEPQSPGQSGSDHDSNELAARMSGQVPAPLVSMRQITKAFPGCIANDQIDLDLVTGRVHALLGENGAGKSTLVKILYGLLQADTGQVLWDGQPVQVDSPSKARELGIAMVFQHFSLFDSLTVLENIALGMDIDANSHLKQRIQDVSAHYGLPLDPDRSVYTLSVGERQRIEIVRCLLQEPRLLIMDEPTSVLTPQEVEVLFTTLERLANEGMSILYISHKLEEIRKLCHDATILRAGKRVATADPSVETASSLAALMMGDEVAVLDAKSSTPLGEILFSANAISLPANENNQQSLSSISLSINAGEIVGIAGVAGNGQDELMQVLAGELTSDKADDVVLNGQDVGHLDAGARRQAGLCCVPEERLGHAAVPSMTLTENVFLTAHHVKNLQVLGMTSQGRCRAFGREVIETFNVQCNGPSSIASSLSGGNLQKFIVGREILQNPKVLIVSQPTWGVDAGAAAAIHKALLMLAQNGSAVLVISQDLDELMMITDRLGALCAGVLSPFYRTADVSVQDVGLLMGGENLPGRDAAGVGL